MNNAKPLTRREEILAAALQMVTTYGFRRTSMQDIADAVGISRPALYLEFKNKTEIFRAAAEDLFEQKIEVARELLEGELPLREKLLGVLNSSFADFQRDIANSPHGDELLSMKEELAGDIYPAWLDNLKLVIISGITEHRDRGEIDTGNTDLSITDIAAIMINAMHGVKSRQATELELRQGAENIVSLVLAAMQSK